ncbi:NUC173-domain-containing protein [Rhizodiscina lignyota]|uniref:NUC173-domain-containing protein n=1 Tax=Rhizodiscina lignyota TaxID=1504668 RepID=A0A9P4I4U6_9PEZI|nr:NUC173-domain-containing protein [Rhizodiscina lignyota]
MSLAERLDKIRSSPRLQNQQQTAVVLSAIEDTLRAESTNASVSDFTPAAYFAALLSLLGQYISPTRGIVNKDIATAVVYLLDLVTPHVPPPLLREKFSQILTSLAPALTHYDAEAPLLRGSIGSLESLLVAQNGAAWQLSQAQISPRRGVAGLLAIAVDHRPKVRKRAQEALTKVLKSPPPSPSLDHPAADMCAESALRTVKDLAEAASKSRKKGHKDNQHHEPALIHSLQLVKTIASASGGWPSRKIDALCELLLDVSRSSNEFLTMAAFEVFEVMFEGMADEVSSAKLPHLLEVISQLQPAATDTQLLPPWMAVISRAYDVSSQVSPEDTFQNLPDIFSKISSFLSSPSHNIRVSASECLISFLSNCIPDSVIIEPSIFDEKTLEKLATNLTDLLNVRYQSAWMEVFSVISAAFDALRYRAAPLLTTVVKTIGDLRGNDSFAGKKEADEVLSQAIHATGPDFVLSVLPLNLLKPQAGKPGRAWLLPLLRDSVSNTKLAHFKEELVPLSENMFQRVLDHGKKDKTMDIKIFETVVQQIWSCLPGYCDLPLDLIEALDQSFAEMLSNLLYQQTELRTDICRALQNLVESNKALIEAVEDGDALKFTRVTRGQAQLNLDHLAPFAGNLLAVLFNVYSQTLPHNRGVLLQCINAYLSITPEKELLETFTRVTTMLESSLQEAANAQSQPDKQKQQKPDANKMPPATHTLMDLLITLSIYLPRSSYPQLFTIATVIINNPQDAQLQKKAYKLIPRISESETGRQALQDRNAELQKLLLDSAEKSSPPSRRDRLIAIGKVVEFLPDQDLYFIPSVLPEVVIATKEVNEKARNAAFDLLVALGQRMRKGGKVAMSKVPHMDTSAEEKNADLEEYLVMVSAGLAGSTPHSVSASVTACTRILYEFRKELKDETVAQLVETMDLFLQSKSREIVRSVLGFVKVCVISLPDGIVRPRLKSLMPSLMGWSHEHKGHFKAKVKHIIERMIRRFGVEEVEKVCPEEDKKLITNIRKTKERKKKNKDGQAEHANDEDVEKEERSARKGRFENEFDEAIYGSEDDESVVSGSDAEDSDGEGGVSLRGASRNGKQKQSQTYIVEDEDEPLDLLDRRALGNISSTRPLKARQLQGKKTKAQTNIDGKLIFNEPPTKSKKSTAKDVDMMDHGANEGDESINAYVDAVSGRDSAKRGQRGKLKFTNRPQKGKNDDDDDMELDEQEIAHARKSNHTSPRTPRGGRGGRANGGSGRGGHSPRGRGRGMQGARMQRRGLGVPKQRQKVRSGRVGK